MPANVLNPEIQTGPPVTYPGWQELAFFMIYFLAVPVISDIQYSSYFPGQYPLNVSFTYSLVNGALSLLMYLFYYLVIVPVFLFKKRYFLFAVLTLLFLVFWDFYIIYVIDGLVAGLKFLPAGVQHIAAASFRRDQGTPLRQSITLTIMQLLAVTALAVFMRSVRQERALHALRKKQLRLELGSLKTQINPDFFFRALGRIRSLVRVKPDTAPAVIVGLSEMMRYMLYDSRQPKVALQQELDFIRSYLETGLNNCAECMPVRLDIQGNAAGLLIEPLLLSTFIKQLLKPDNRERPDTACAEIAVLLYRNELTLQVKKNSGDQSMRITPVSLGRIRELLALHYPAGHALLFDETASAYEMNLTLSLAYEI